MKNRDKLLKISNKIEYNAQSLNYDFHSGLPWHLKRLMCNIYLKGLKEGLEEISKLLPHTNETKRRIPKINGTLEQLIEKIYRKASWLNTSFHAPKYSLEELNFQESRVYFNVLEARVKEFEERYNEEVEAKKNDPVEDALIKELIPEDVQDKVEAIKAQRNK